MIDLPRERKRRVYALVRGDLAPAALTVYGKTALALLTATGVVVALGAHAHAAVSGVVFALVLLGPAVVGAAEPDWKVGLARVKITPERPVFMSGYASRNRPFDRVVADLYAKAADYKSNEFFTPGYLLKEATAREMTKDYEGALKAYDRILTEYPAAPEANDAKQLKGRAEGLAGK